jgi:hypothetical protein
MLVLKMNFETWYAVNKNIRGFQEEYMAYFYAWEGWTVKTDQDPLSYRAWMKKRFEA